MNENLTKLKYNIRAKPWLHANREALRRAVAFAAHLTLCRNTLREAQ